MKTILFTATLFLFVACGPAAESRERMDTVAQRTSDSLDRSLDSALNDPIKEMAAPTSSVTTMAPVKTTTEEDK